MKSKTIYLTWLLFFAVMTLPVYSQKYKTVSDTIKLNKEYKEVSDDIAHLKSELASAKNNLPGYESKARSAEDRAKNAAETSSDKASKATNGNVKDARRAQKQAKKTYRRAKHSRSADEDVDQQEDRIARLTEKLNAKEGRLSELQRMRSSIEVQLPAKNPATFPIDSLKN